MRKKEKLKATPYFLTAAFRGDLETVRYYVARHMSVNIKNAFGETALHEALSNAQRIDQKEMIRFLLDNGADIKAVTANGNTPLIIAAQTNNVEIVEMLLEKGDCLINAQNNEGYTPLLWAIRKDSPAIAKLLIDNGADINISTADNESPLEWALKKAYNGDHKQAFAEIAERLIQMGAYVNSVNRWKITPLHCAIEFGLEDIAALLIEKGADVNACAMDDATLLHESVRQGSLKITQTLIAKGVDVNGRDDSGRTPLINAAAAMKPEMLDLLMENGADINALSREGRTVLHEAALCDSDKGAKSFLDYGVYIFAKDADGKTAMDIACHFHSRKFIRVLADYLKQLPAKYANLASEELRAYLLDDNRLEEIRYAFLKDFGSVAAKLNATDQMRVFVRIHNKLSPMEKKSYEKAVREHRLQTMREAVAPSSKRTGVKRNIIADKQKIRD